MRNIDSENPCQLQDVDGSSSAVTTPGDIMLQLETPTTPLPPHSPHTTTTTDSIPPLEDVLGPPPAYSGQSQWMNPCETAPPPSYDEVHCLNVPPPTYDSLSGRVREVHKASNGILDFIRNLIILLLGTIGCTMMIGVTIIIPILMIIIGLLKMNDCPAEKCIPVYLIVGGTFGVLKSLLGFEVNRRGREDETVEVQNAPVPWHRRIQFGGSINFFLSIWFIFGCVWVYGIFEPSYERGSHDYCDYTLYQFSFWLLTSAFLCMGLLMSCMCCLSVATVVMQHSHNSGAQV